ncbi:MAG: choice-of-anchor J domain-containing protein [Dysgonamonadaceae bacterium]|jgi:M6 family metalloprotease-like protein|nr:choice-of-anchor J domain-containing protein [Dysgonamonadaceae bacterium]
MIRKLIFCLLLCIYCAILQEVFAVPAVPWPVEKVQPDGSKITVYLKGDEKVHWMESMDGYTLMYDSMKYVVYAEKDSEGNLVPSKVKFGNSSSNIPVKEKGLRYSKQQVAMLRQIWEMTEKEQNRAPVWGEKKALCILMGFSNKPFSKTVSEFSDLMNQVGYTAGGAKGSVKDFYRENSYNKMDLTVTVVGTYQAPNTSVYYATHEREFAKLAAETADADVDYTEFAVNGTLETFHIIFAGYGDEAIDNGQQIWSHKWQLATPIYLDGVKISVYSCSPELRGSSGSNITYIGVIAHELCHVFGAPDYYDIDYSGFNGTGQWDLMANGSWNDNGRQPAHINMLQKVVFDWVEPIELTEETQITDMPNSAQNAVAYTIKAHSNGEEYLLENKQYVGFDASLPGHGLLIYHVHQSALSGNGSNDNHPQQLYPVVASSTVAIPNSSPSSYGNINSAGTPFPGTSGKSAFTDLSIPQAFTWQGLTGIGKPVTNITESNGKIAFDFMAGFIKDPVTELDAAVDGAKVTLSWTAPDNQVVLGYNIYRNDVFQNYISGKTNTTYSQINVPNGNYTYCVRAKYEFTESDATCIPVVVTAGSNGTCPPVRNLSATVMENKATLNWDAPFTGGWVGIAGNPSYYYRFNSVWDFFAGTLWTPSDLSGTNGFKISKIKFVPYETAATHTVVIYKVTAAGEREVIHTQPINSSALSYSGVYNEIALTTPVEYNASEGLIVGIQFHTLGGNVLSVDNSGLQYPNRNIYYDQDGWYFLQDIGVPLGRNFCLQAYLEASDGSSVVLKPEEVSPQIDLSFLSEGVVRDKKWMVGDVQLTENLQAPDYALGSLVKYDIYRNGEWIDETTGTSYINEGLAPATYSYCVSAVYSNGCNSEGVCVEAKVENPYKSVTDLHVSVIENEVTIEWEPYKDKVILFEEGFESAIPSSWTNIDSDGDEEKWYSLIASSEATPYSGSGLATSASWKSGKGPLSPDNWLITPAVTLESHSTLTYHVGVQNTTYPAERYGVYISTTNTNTSSFSLLYEETMTAASPEYQGNDEITAKDASLSSEPQYVQGAWKERNIDLSAYAGQTVYIAFRHFNTVDKWRLNLDDVKITYEVVNCVFDVYANEELIADNLTETHLDLTGVTAGNYNYCVMAVYGGVNESDPVCASVAVKNPYKPVTNLEVQVSGQDVTIDWECANEDKMVTLFEEGFENGIPSSWKNMDVDGDGEKWYEIVNVSTITPHNGVGLVTSASYKSGVLYPNNWLITPAVRLRTNSKLTYYIGAQDAAYPTEHYGVYISTTNTDISSFSLLFEETMTASPGYQVNGQVAEDAFRSSGPQYAQGAWYERNIDLSPYAGQTVYIAFRHFNTVDKFRLNLDDVKVTCTISHSVVFDVYANEELIANDLTETHWELTGVTAGDYNYCVAAVYDNTNESEQVCQEVEVIDPHHPVRNLTVGTIEKMGTLTWEVPAGNSHVLSADDIPNRVIPALTKYIIRRDGVWVGETTGTTYSETVDNLGYYNYCVTAFYEDGKESKPVCEDATYVSECEGILTVDAAINGNQVSLDWSFAPANPLTSGEPAFNIYQNNTLIADRVTGNHYEVTFTSNDKGTYAYCVSFVGAYCESAPVCADVINFNPLTIASAIAESKVYDGNTTTTISDIAFSGLDEGVALTEGTDYSVNAAFDDAGAGNDKAVAVTVSLLGEAASTYWLVSSTFNTTAAISKKELSVTGITADNKTYDGTTTATVSGEATLSGIVENDDVTLTGTPVYTFADANVAEAIEVTVNGFELSGSKNVNYMLTYPVLSADITPAPLIVTPDEGQNKFINDPDPVLTYEAKGWKLDDNETLLSGLLSRTEGETAGFYEILQGSLVVGSNNYAINFVPGILFEIKENVGIPSITTSGVKIYPNPSLRGQTFYVATDVPDAVIQVFTLTGILITQQRAITPLTEMNLAVSQGIYIISVGGEKAKIEIR